MPQIGHGLLAVGLYAATAHRPAAPVLRSAWPGVLLLGAYLPDVVEWLFKVAGGHVAHSGLASVPVLACYLAAAALWLWSLRERDPVVICTLLAAIASHTVLDALSGGIPLWWPIWDRRVGGTLLEVWDFPLSHKLLLETTRYAPVALLGVALAIARRGGPGRGAAALALLAASGVAWWQSSAVSMAVIAAAMVAIAASCCRPWVEHGWGRGVVFASPVLLLAVAHVCAWLAVDRGNELFTRGEYAAAKSWYEAVVPLRIIGLAGVGELRAGQCELKLGDEAAALVQFERSLREQPRSPDTLRALVELHLSAADGHIRDLREAERLAQILRGSARSAAEYRLLTRFCDEAAGRIAAARANGSN